MVTQCDYNFSLFLWLEIATGKSNLVFTIGTQNCIVGGYRRPTNPVQMPLTYHTPRTCHTHDDDEKATTTTTTKATAVASFNTKQIVKATQLKPHFNNTLIRMVFVNVSRVTRFVEISHMGQNF